jgi:hypothetical protein
VLSLRSDLGSREFKEVKVMILGRGKALYLYGTVVTIQEPSRKPRECLGFLKDDSNDFGKIPSTRGNLWEGFPKAVEASASSQSQSDSSLRSFEHCIPVLVTKFKLSEATSASALWLCTLSGA